MLESGERQVAPDVDGIRRDHTARYEWVAKRLAPGSRVIDFACGVGYGALILARAGHIVNAIDRDEEAIAYAREHYSHPGINFHCGDQSKLSEFAPNAFDAVLSFEAIEHIEDPLPVLKLCRELAPQLFASVPNEDKFPHRGMIAFHHRHYRPHEFKELLEQAGFVVNSWHGQEGKESDVEDDRMGRTIIACAERGEQKSNVVDLAPKQVAPQPAGPRHVSIVGLGPSAQHYMDVVKKLGGRHAFCDETWVINSLGDVLDADRVFHMDDLKIQEIRAAAAPKSNIANMIKWMRKHPGPIYTSRLHPHYPGLVEFPLQDVLNDLGYEYFNNTAAYAIAYAIHLKVEKITFWGCDFTWPKAHDAERGRACCEYWIGRAMQRGIQIAVTQKSTLLDACAPPAKRLYGYDAVDVDIAEQPDRSLKVTFKEKTDLPSAAEIEHDYDHGRHPAEAVMNG
jgi:hypothetical protein